MNHLIFVMGRDIESQGREVTQADMGCETLESQAAGRLFVVCLVPYTLLLDV